jgi:hypothetical protein
MNDWSIPRKVICKRTYKCGNPCSEHSKVHDWSRRCDHLCAEIGDAKVPCISVLPFIVEKDIKNG